MQRRRRHDRRKRILARRREDALFFGRGTFPASACSISMCSCGARMFTRDPRDFDALADFEQAHAYCDEAVAS